MRVNVTFERGLLRAIDEAAKDRSLTRSAFLANAARREIEGAHEHNLFQIDGAILIPDQLRQTAAVIRKPARDDTGRGEKTREQIGKRSLENLKRFKTLIGPSGTTTTVSLGRRCPTTSSPRTCHRAA